MRENRLKMNIKTTSLKIFTLLVVLIITVFFTDLSYINADSNSDILICVDPGHGGYDPGAIGPTGLTEKEVNLDISIRLKNKLQSAGYRVIMTRESDVYKSLSDRANFANTSGAHIFVSIHNNAFTLPTPNGTETYYSTYSPELSRELAIDVHYETLNKINTYNRGVKTANFYVLKNTNMISALLEGVFISNPTEEAKLRDSSFRDKMATGVYNGIVKFLGSNDVSSYDASINDLGNTPDRMLPNAEATFNIRVTNNSDSFTWSSSGNNKVRISYHVYNKYGDIVIYEGLRTDLPEDISPGESATIPVTIKAPGNGGTYTIEYDLVHEGITWFNNRDSRTLKKSIIVIDEECIAGYFTNLYEGLILETPGQEIIDDAVADLADGTKTAGDVITELMASQQFADRDLDNAGFVETLYRAFFDRDPDTRGYNYWLGKLNAGMSKNAVINNFLRSPEFKNICKDINIESGFAVYDESADDDDGDDSGDDGEDDGDDDDGDDGENGDEEEPTILEIFTVNLYEGLILETPGQETIDDAVADLADGTKTAGDVITELMASQQFADRDLDNAGFVETLYRAFFDRDPDTRGYNYWLGKLNAGTSRQSVINSFIISSEFRNICGGCGITVGSVNYEYEDGENQTSITISNSTNIVGQASAAKSQLVQIFTDRNPSQVTRAQGLADLYIYWGNLFNIRYDIAWAQMCHETGFLGYTGIVPPDANNFAGIGATGQKDENGNYVYNTFASEELGVIAHYIHLAWYSTPDHLDIRDSEGDLYCSTKYDPRHFGTSHNYNGDGTLNCLNTRWAPSSTYTAKIIQFANEIYN